MRSPAFAALTLLALAVACSPIIAEPLSDAPLNAGCLDVHKCELYTVPGVTVKSQCHDGRCDYGLPTYPFTVVVNVPDTSFYAPGRSFVLTNKDLSAQPGTTSGTSTCKPPLCVPLQELVRAIGTYRVTNDASNKVGLPLPEGTSIPIRVTLVPLLDGTLQEAATVGIPAVDVLTSSLAVVPPGTTDAPVVQYVDAVSVGRYLRIAYPEPPFDQYFPPAFTAPVSASIQTLTDDFVLGDAKRPLDDDTLTGDTRLATVSRADGLDGWQAWLIDTVSGRRISSLRTLAGKTMEVRLDTVGQTDPSTGALKDNVEVIVAPPASFIGVPRLQSGLPHGQGLQTLDVPPLPGPASVTGVVAVGEGTALTGIPSRVRFDSASLRQKDGQSSMLLKYSTSVSTDSAGRFATVLPPGLYDVTVEPGELTGRAKYKDTFDTSAGLAKTYQPPPRTTVSGTVVLADGRPLAEAEIRALPSDVPVTGSAVKPRPAHTRTDRAGAFSLDVDQGQYDFVVDPQAGTGFPRLVQVRSFATGTAMLEPIVIGPPARLSFLLKDPTQNKNPIGRAVVRVFAEPPRGPPAIEIASTMTDVLGQCEILLAQQPR
ncbi:MAG: hypothetical protein JWO86_432 [Myxococcaceae bacterium]|nr:hypothetical protein [Myxococcaceae bacterium]